ncbi:PIN domain-containing protein [Rhodococcus pyridinivorans]|uniref:PIN domain-containing protein n=1 Tax=Rhodococcus pyridinivorans TaxID=103816 RepID=UPI00368F10CE
MDTSTWLDLAKRRDGQKYIRALDELVDDGSLQLLVPPVVIDEFQRNRPRVEKLITTSIAERLKSIRKEIDVYGNDEHKEARQAIDGLAHHVPLIGAMTTRNFDDIEELLCNGLLLAPTDDERSRVVARALEKRAPFHRTKNSVADALIIEAYATAVAASGSSEDLHGFITSNSDDFSLVNGDQRQPHLDFSEIFEGSESIYWLGVEGFESALIDYFDADYMSDLYDMFDYSEDPRRLDEILEAESDHFDLIWYHRSLQYDIKLKMNGDTARLERHQVTAANGRTRVGEKFEGTDRLGPYTDFELGMLSGKLSALRWVLGSEWDFLDT